MTAQQSGDGKSNTSPRHHFPLTFQALRQTQPDVTPRSMKPFSSESPSDELAFAISFIKSTEAGSSSLRITRSPSCPTSVWMTAHAISTLEWDVFCNQSGRIWLVGTIPQKTAVIYNNSCGRRESRPRPLEHFRSTSLRPYVFSPLCAILSPVVHDGNPSDDRRRMLVDKSNGANTLSDVTKEKSSLEKERCLLIACAILLTLLANHGRIWEIVVVKPSHATSLALGLHRPLCRHHCYTPSRCRRNCADSQAGVHVPLD